MRFNQSRVREALLLCAVTDRHWIARTRQAAVPNDGPKPNASRAGVADPHGNREVHTLEGQVADAIAGGATMIQLREKGLSPDEYASLATRVRRVTEALGIPLIVNDSLEAALASGADGVHLGQGDGDPALARKKLGPRAIIGVSAHTAAEAQAAARAGADYIGVGAAFPTGTKEGITILSRDALREIVSSVAIPAIAIGGITDRNASELSGLGLAGVAAISAIFSDPDRVRESASRLLASARIVAGRRETGDRR